MDRSMKWLRRLATVFACLALAACFMSETPIIPEDGGDFPFTRFAFTQTGESETVTLVRSDRGYAEADDPEKPDRFWLRQLRPGIYLMQLRFGEATEIGYAYATLRIDVAARTMETFKATASPTDADPVAGLRRCQGDTICIDNADAYIALALAAIDRGEPPEATYVLNEVE